MFIIDLHELHFRELFEVLHERARNGIERAVRLTTASQVDMRHAIGKCQFAVTGETVEHESEALIAFDIAGTFEIFIEHRTDQILGRGDVTRRGDLIRKLAGDQTVVIREVDIDLHV